jgi:hypothetical protein
MTARARDGRKKRERSAARTRAEPSYALPRDRAARRHAAAEGHRAERIGAADWARTADRVRTTKGIPVTERGRNPQRARGVRPGRRKPPAREVRPDGVGAGPREAAPAEPAASAGTSPQSGGVPGVAPDDRLPVCRAPGGGRRRSCPAGGRAVGAAPPGEVSRTGPESSHRRTQDQILATPAPREHGRWHTDQGSGIRSPDPAQLRAP